MNLHAQIDAAFDEFKGFRTSRQHRMNFAEQLTEQYFEKHGEMPPCSVLDRLATLILQDELADKDYLKMQKNEYPLLSDSQEKYRNRRKRSMKAADEIAADGKNYRIRTHDSNRRMREAFGL